MRYRVWLELSKSSSCPWTQPKFRLRRLYLDSLSLYFTGYLITMWVIFSKVLDRVCIVKSLLWIQHRKPEACGLAMIFGTSNGIKVAPLVDNSTSLNGKSYQSHSQKFQEELLTCDR